MELGGGGQLSGRILALNPLGCEFEPRYGRVFSTQVGRLNLAMWFEVGFPGEFQRI